MVRGRVLPWTLLPATGFAAIIAVGGIITCFPGLAEFTTGAVTGLAVAGYLALFTGGPRGPARSPAFFKPRSEWVWPAVAAAGVFFVFGAPVILSGSATFAGYVKLDDTSTWLAFTDHVMAHGHSVAGLAPSSYEATVQINLSSGYPLGAFIPLGVGHELTGQDSAWLFQPYLALMASFMSLVFYELAAPVVRDHRLRAAAVFIAAQPSLLVGYAFWGGIKEVATALLVAIQAAGAAGLARHPEPRGATVVPIVSGAALIGVMGAGGLPWLAVIFAGAALLMAAKIWSLRREGGEVSGLVRKMLIASAIVLVGVVAIGLPTVFASGTLFSPNQDALTKGSEEMGNLIRPLGLAQYPGPWPVGDFRVEPVSNLANLLTTLLVIATLVAAGFGLLAAISRRAWGLLLLTFGTGLGSLVVWLVGSPWVQGKALATGSASFLILAMAGIGFLLGGGSQAEVEGEVESRSSLFSGVSATGLRTIGAALLIVPCGVLVSSALAYHESWLAPRAQLAELSQIGQEFKGQGPALMTEYQAYGVRHFLRLLDAEGASELRRRVIPRLDGTQAEKGSWSDTDELVMDPGQQGVLTYRTLVLRRNPKQSRPPSPYELVWQGRYYEVWQRDPDYEASRLIVHHPLGGGFQPAAVPNCAVVQNVAAQAGQTGKVVAALREPNAVANLTEYPPDWVPDPPNKTLTPLSDGTASGEVEIPRSGEYHVWVGGSARGKVSVEIGGQNAGSARGMLNNNAQFMGLDDLDFEAGTDPVAMTYKKGSDLRPATGGYPFGIGPVVLAPVAEPKVVTVSPANAQKLCGKSLDWVEAVR
ncbi:MAG TPA: hypothetical protein PLB47_11120 [Solirubrobacterales bacterium]|nr:hypothetical protein [Solirubrobacterales bacterium]